MKQKVLYTLRDNDNLLVDKVRVFSDADAANSFFKEIKAKSVTTPIIEDINERNEFEQR